MSNSKLQVARLTDQCGGSQWQHAWQQACKGNMHVSQALKKMLIGGQSLHKHEVLRADDFQRVRVAQQQLMKLPSFVSSFRSPLPPLPQHSSSGVQKASTACCACFATPTHATAYFYALGSVHTDGYEILCLLALRTPIPVLIP